MDELTKKIAQNFQCRYTVFEDGAGFGGAGLPQGIRGRKGMRLLAGGYLS